MKASKVLLMHGLGMSAFAMIALSPANAEGKADRARAAIAEATGKIDAAEKIGAGTTVPAVQADAQAALRAAKEDLAAGRKKDSIAAANRASRLADTALGETQRRKADADQARQADAQAAAADANARAAAAEQVAAAASADAAAARATPVIVATPAPAPTTVVTTETTRQVATAPRPVAKKKIVRRTTAVKRPATTSAVSEKTTTTVTTSN